MPEWFQVWIDDTPGETVEHLAEHGVTPEEAERVLLVGIDDRESSRSAPGRWVVQGHTAAGRYLVVVFELDEEAALAIVVTAYEPG